MQRKYGYRLSSVLVATVLSVGMVAGCGAQSTTGTPTTQPATESTAPSSSPSAVAQSTSGPTAPVTGITGSGATGSTGAIGSSSTGSGGGITAAGVPRCHTVDLSPEASLVAGSAGAGQMELNIRLTNTSGHACTIYGYPGMRLEDQSVNGQSTTVNRDPGVPEKILTLVENGSAATTAQFDFDIPVLPGEPTSGPCEPESVYLEITPPDETTQLITRITGGPITVCDHGTLNVLPFVAGPTGPNQ
jgi:hypothetical protein